MQVLAVEKGLAERMEKIKENDLSRDLNLDSAPQTPDSEDVRTPGGTPGGPNDDPLYDMRAKGEMRKDKSLGIMSQKFLMLFLVAKVS